MEGMSINGLVALCGFGLGIVFGAIVQRTNFCTMGGISDGVLMGNWNRFRAWMLAIAIAIIGTQALQMTGVINLSKSIYQTANFGWAGAIIGGLMFGFGMVLGGGCGNRTVVRFGAGNLKSLVVLLMLGLFAYMTLRGLIALARVELEGATNVDLRSAGLATQGIPDIVSAVLGVSMAVIRPVIAAIAAVALLVFCFKSAAFRTSGRDIAAGLVIGAVVIGGWYITGVIGHDEFEPTRLESVTFVAPVGQSLQYLMTFTGSKINFGIAVVGGVIAGAFLMAKLRGEFRIEAFGGAADMLRHLVGGALMGTGGVLALGCTIGQGITGNSTLALGSLIAILSIIAGGVLGIRYLEEGSLGGAVKAVFARG
jgi:uncharacterized membrane protein YedE/YeeE